MANMIKKSTMQDIGHLCAHYERSVAPGHYSNENIDQTRIHEDHINLGPDRHATYAKDTDYIKHMIKEVMGDRTLRKDAVRMVTWVVDVPDSIPIEERPTFFREAYNFLVDRYGRKSGMGEDIVISCYIHKSETREHMHFAFMPILEKNGKRSFCAKEVVDRDDLRSFHTDLADYMEARNICKKSDIVNGNTIKDSTGRALSVRELKNRTRKMEHEHEQRERASINKWDDIQINNNERGLNRWQA